MTTDQQYLAGQVLLVSYGRVGTRIALALTKNNIPFVVAEENCEVVEELRKKAFPPYRAMLLNLAY